MTDEGLASGQSAAADASTLFESSRRRVDPSSALRATFSRKERRGLRPSFLVPLVGEMRLAQVESRSIRRRGSSFSLPSR